MARIVCESILEHFNLICEIYEEAITKIPDDYWKDGDIEYLIPARQIFHVTESADYYSSQNEKDFHWGHRFGTRARETKKENFPGKEELMKYHIEVKEKINKWIRSSNDEELLAYQNAYKWTGKTLLSRLIYILSHHRQHFGEINAELRRHEIDRIKWKLL